MAEDKLSISPDVRIKAIGVTSVEITKFLERLKAVPDTDSEGRFTVVDAWVRELGLDDKTRHWRFDVDPENGDVILYIPIEAYKIAPQNAREWSVLAGVCEQIGPLFELATGANASRREDN